MNRLAIWAPVITIAVNIDLDKTAMNRKKKIFDIFNKKVRKAKARLNPGTKGSKPKYISKAQREKLALEQQEAQSQDLPETTEPDQTA